jgi:DNA-binding XRE family transcriptional regulator
MSNKNRPRLTSIKECRLKAGLTQQQVSEQLGIKDIRTYQYMEDGCISLKIVAAHKMSKLFRCDFNELLALPPGADPNLVFKDCQET